MSALLTGRIASDASCNPVSFQYGARAMTVSMVLNVTRGEHHIKTSIQVHGILMVGEHASISLTQRHISVHAWDLKAFNRQGIM